MPVALLEFVGDGAVRQRSSVSSWMTASCSRGSNGLPFASIGVSPSDSSSILNLRSMAQMPSIQAELLELRRHRRERPVEVVDDDQQLAQQELVGEPQGRLTLLLGAALVVGEVRRGALPTGARLAGLLLGGQQLPAQLVELLGQLRRARHRGVDAVPGRAFGAAVGVGSVRRGPFVRSFMRTGDPPIRS